MPDKSRKFLTLIENHITRGTNGGILVGDVVTFVKNFKSLPEFKSLPDGIKDAILDLTSSDLNLRVVNIKPQYPSRAPGEEANRGTGYTIEIAQELAPGLIYKQNKIAVDVKLLEPQNTYPNLPKIPDSMKRNDKFTLKPELVKQEDNEESVNTPYHQTNMTQQGDTLGKTEKTLPQSNTKIPSVDAKPTYTGMYLPN